MNKITAINRNIWEPSDGIGVSMCTTGKVFWTVVNGIHRSLNITKFIQYESLKSI